MKSALVVIGRKDIRVSGFNNFDTSLHSYQETRSRQYSQRFTESPQIVHLWRQAAQNEALYLTGEYEEGGLKDVDIEAKFSALKFLWIKKLKDPTNHHPWQVVACEFLTNFSGDKLIYSNLELSGYCKPILNPIRPGGSEARMTKLTAANQKPLTR